MWVNDRLASSTRPAIMDTSHGVMLVIVAWIVFLEATPRLLSDFASRKLCHAGCGAGMMCLDSTALAARVFVWAVAASSIAMTWDLSPLPPFRFARRRDVGITVYLLLVSAWSVVLVFRVFRELESLRSTTASVGFAI